MWIGPSGHTAFGVIKFSLPLPVGPEMVLPFFLREMRASEGQATLIEKHHDADLDALRFVAEGGLYKVRSILMTRGWKGWVIYAGTLRAHDEDEYELDLAEQARENTRVGVN